MLPRCGVDIMPSVDFKLTKHGFIAGLPDATTKEMRLFILRVWFDVEKNNSDTELHYLWRFIALDTNTNR